MQKAGFGFTYIFISQISLWFYEVNINRVSFYLISGNHSSQWKKTFNLLKQRRPQMKMTVTKTVNECFSEWFSFPNKGESEKV